MAFSHVKIHYYQSMFRIGSRRFLVFSAMIPIACVISLAGTAQVVSSQIQDQVQQHLLQLNAISAHCGNIGRQLGPHRNTTL